MNDISRLYQESWMTVQTLQIERNDTASLNIVHLNGRNEWHYIQKLQMNDITFNNNKWMTLHLILL